MSTHQGHLSCYKDAILATKVANSAQKSSYFKQGLVCAALVMLQVMCTGISSTRGGLLDPQHLRLIIHSEGTENNWFTDSLSSKESCNPRPPTPAWQLLHVLQNSSWSAVPHTSCHTAVANKAVALLVAAMLPPCSAQQQQASCSVAPAAGPRSPFPPPACEGLGEESMPPSPSTDGEHHPCLQLIPVAVSLLWDRGSKKQFPSCHSPMCTSPQHYLCRATNEPVSKV